MHVTDRKLINIQNDSYSIEPFPHSTLTDVFIALSAASSQGRPRQRTTLNSTLSSESSLGGRRHGMFQFRRVCTAAVFSRRCKRWSAIFNMSMLMERSAVVLIRVRVSS
jgi:hypothetical protein